MDVMALDKEYVANTYKRNGIVIKSGHGSRLFDENGKEYIDLGSGIAANAFGVCDPEWQKAVINQVLSVQHASNLYYTAPQARLAELLCQKTGMKKVFFSNSGAEANECAIKVARKFASDEGRGRDTIITLVNSFHGRTVTTLSATGQDSFHTNFGPFTPGFKHVPANDSEALDKAADGQVCAIMLEMIQGEGGVLPLTASFVEAVQNICRERDMLLIVDEVQTGNGRTGKLYSYENFGVEPDIVSTAKGLGGGLPIGATMMNERTMNVLTYGTHGSTFGGNPVCAAGALSVLSRIDASFLSEVKAKGQYIFEEFPEATGMGLMVGIPTKKPAGEVIARAMDMGVIALTAKTKVRLLPALNIPWDDLKRGIAILKEAMK